MKTTAPSIRRGACVLFLLGLTLATMACSQQISPTRVGRTTTAPPDQETTATTIPAVFQVGDIVSIADVVIVVVGWNTSTGGDVIKPEAGKIFVGVDLVLVNQGDDPVSVAPAFQMKLKDDTGQQYAVGLGATAVVAKGMPNGEISPGERVRGQVGFPVPESATGLQLTFDPEWWTQGKVIIELGPEPVSGDLPGPISGERTLETFSVGDLIEIGDLTLVVNSVSNPPGGPLTQPAPGCKFVVVDMTLTNNGAETKTIVSGAQMSLKDSTAQLYDVHLTAQVASGGTLPDGDYAPGETIRGQVGFQVQQEASGLVFVFDPSGWGWGKVFVALP